MHCIVWGFKSGICAKMLEKLTKFLKAAQHLTFLLKPYSTDLSYFNRYFVLLHRLLIDHKGVALFQVQLFSLIHLLIAIRFFCFSLLYQRNISNLLNSLIWFDSIHFLFGETSLICNLLSMEVSLMGCYYVWILLQNPNSSRMLPIIANT